LVLAAENSWALGAKERLSFKREERGSFKVRTWGKCPSSLNHEKKKLDFLCVDQRELGGILCF